jgi:hypothetical protein
MISTYEDTSYAGEKDENCYFCVTGVGHTAFEHSALSKLSAKPIKAAITPQAAESLEAEILKMSVIDVINALENGDLLNRVRSKSEARAILAKVQSLQKSTGSYQRLCYDLAQVLDD